MDKRIDPKIQRSRDEKYAEVQRLLAEDREAEKKRRKFRLLRGGKR